MSTTWSDTAEDLFEEEPVDNLCLGPPLEACGDPVAPGDRWCPAHRAEYDRASHADKGTR